MTLRALQTAGLLDIGEAAPTPSTAPSTALAFALGAADLTPFKVFLYSLARVGAFADYPFYVYSDDPALFADPVVARVTDRAATVSDPLQKKLQRLARTQILQPERADWNPGAFLKWTLFEPAEVEQLLFLDVDMLCLRNPWALVAQPEPADLRTCPQFQPQMLMGPGGPVGEAEAYERLSRFCDGGLPQFSPRLDSGVMLVGKRLLSEGIRKQLIKEAKTRVLKDEQAHLAAFFSASDYSVAMASPIFNFQESYLKTLDAGHGRALLRRIHILRYAGDDKPWKGAPAKDTRDSQRLWWSHRDAAGLSSGLFGR